MNCQQFQEHISAFLDGDVTPADGAAFRAHQLECTDCRSLFEDVSVAIASCAALPEEEPPLELLSRTLVIPALNAPIDCDRFAELVTEFLDGFLEASVYHAFEDHAKACDGCSEILSGVALAVSACHSVHFSEELDVPDSLVASILAETTGAAGEKGRSRSVWSRLFGILSPVSGPIWAPRIATAAFIVAAFSLFVGTGGQLAPSALYQSAARITNQVYDRSADLASTTDHVLDEMGRIKSDVDEVFGAEESSTDEAPTEPAPAEGRDESRVREVNRGTNA